MTVSLLNESYQDRVKAVADAVIKRSASSPFTKEELLRAIEREAEYANVAEVKFKDTPRSTAWKDFVKDVVNSTKGKIKWSRPGVAAAATDRKAKQEKLLKAVAQIIEHAVSETFPDGDPMNYIWPRLKRLGVQEYYDVYDLLDRACKKVLGFKSFDDYMGNMYDDYFADNPAALAQSGLTRNPYTNKPFDMADVLSNLIKLPHSESYILHILYYSHQTKNPKIIAIVTANKETILKALLQAIKLKPDAVTPKIVVRNLISAGVDWPEFEAIQKSIDPVGLGETEMKLGDILTIEGLKEAVVGTVISFDKDTIIIEGSNYGFSQEEINENITNKLLEAEYQGKKVQLGKPTRDTGGSKKFKVYVKNPKTGNIKKVSFGDRELSIKRDDPERRRSFRARHKCDQKKDKTTAGYWSCKLWGKKNVSDIV